MSYVQPRRAKWIVGIVLGLAVIALFSRPHIGRIKHAYFNTVLSWCAERNGMDKVRWAKVPAYDAAVMQFIAFNKAEEATIGCVNTWAGMIIVDEAEPLGPGEAPGTGVLQTEVRGGHYAPPAYHVTIRTFQLPRA
jgi:hypothetical protein